jgi:phytol kinase
LIGFAKLVGYYLSALSVALLSKKVFKLQREPMRKALHIICAMSVFVYTYAFDTWYVSVMVAVSFSILVYPLVGIAQRFKPVMALLNERRPGEVKKSLLIVQLMIALLVSVFWGWFGEAWKYIIIVAVMAWGFGDAAAALVGKAWGRRKIVHRWVDGNKTVEGTLAMYVVSGIALLVSLLLFSNAPWYVGVLVSVLVAPICAVVELLSRHGMDTFTVPISTAIPAFALMYLFYVIGV